MTSIIVIYTAMTEDQIVIGPFLTVHAADEWCAERQAKGIPGKWLIDTMVDPGEAWNMAGESRRTEIEDDPKDEGYHSLHADLWDQREGK